MIVSPTLTPPAAAGDPAMTRSTLKTLLAEDMMTPMPATLALNDCWKAAYCAGVRKVEWPVSPRLSTIPLRAPYRSCWSVTDDRPTKRLLMIWSASLYRVEFSALPAGAAELAG